MGFRPTHLLSRTLQHSSVRGVLSLTGATAVGHLSYLLALPAITRMYSESSIADLGILLGILGLLSPIASLRLQLAIPVAANQSVANLTRLAIALSLTIALVVSVVAACGGLAVAGATQSLTHAGVLGGMLAATALHQILAARATRSRSFRLIGVSRGIQGATTGLAQVGAGMLGMLSIGPAIGDLVGRTAALVALRLGPTADESAPLAPRIGVRAVLKQYRGLMVTGSLAGLFNAAALNLPVLLLGSLWGTGAAASFFLASRVVSAPAALITQSVASVFAADFSAQDSCAGKSRLVTRYVRSLLALAAVPALAMAAFAPPIFALALGEDWRSAGWMASALAPSLALQIAVSPTSAALLMAGHERIQARWDAMRLIGVLGVFLCADAWSIPATVTVAAYSGLIGIAYLALYRITTGTLLSQSEHRRN